MKRPLPDRVTAGYGHGLAGERSGAFLDPTNREIGRPKLKSLLTEINKDLHIIYVEQILVYKFTEI